MFPSPRLFANFHARIGVAWASRCWHCSAAAARAVDYLRNVRPILAGKCFACHGADDAVRQAGLRLDDSTSATAPLESGHRAIVPGKPAESELLARITAANPDTAMPPAATGKHLSPAEIDIWRAWITAARCMRNIGPM